MEKPEINYKDIGELNTDLIMDNINGAIKQSEQNSFVYQILELQDELQAIELQLNTAKQALMNQMIASGIKTINHKLAVFTVAERKNIKVDVDKAKAFLDSMGTYEEFSKLDETKVKKIYPTAEFITENEPTKYLTIKENK